MCKEITLLVVFNLYLITCYFYIVTIITSHSFNISCNQHHPFSLSLAERERSLCRPPLRQACGDGIFTHVLFVSHTILDLASCCICRFTEASYLCILIPFIYLFVSNCVLSGNIVVLCF